MTECSWKDTNLALFGSDVEKSIKKESAETEPAWGVVRSIKETKTLAWRIKSFKLEPVGQDDLGKFFSGDSYVVLHTHKVGDELLYDVHFWIGRDSTQDEYGTAAYKTVELDTFLDDKAIQHREVDGMESEKFKSYFTRFEKLEGGYTSGFKHVKPEEFKKRLLLYHSVNPKHAELYEVTLSRNAVTSDDVYILDLGSEIYQWNGQKSSGSEKASAMQFVQHLESERGGKCRTFVVDEFDTAESKKFIDLLPDVPVREKLESKVSKKSIYKLSDKSGKLEFTLVCEERLTKNALTDDDVLFINSGKELFVYLGSKCSVQEKRNALSYAHDHLKENCNPYMPITVISAGQFSKELDALFE